MKDQTKIMISLGAATAANCIPCFEHLYHHAKSQNISDETIKEIVDIASKVKSGAHVAIKGTIEECMEPDKLNDTNDTFNQERNQDCSCGCLN